MKSTIFASAPPTPDRAAPPFARPKNQREKGSFGLPASRRDGLGGELVRRGGRERPTRAPLTDGPRRLHPQRCPPIGGQERAGRKVCGDSLSCAVGGPRRLTAPLPTATRPHPRASARPRPGSASPSPPPHSTTSSRRCRRRKTRTPPHRRRAETRTASRFAACLPAAGMGRATDRPLPFRRYSSVCGQRRRRRPQGMSLGQTRWRWRTRGR